ncbi:MAG: hypothetical protein ACRDBY_15095 [Cetobacterium sp.]
MLDNLMKNLGATAKWLIGAGAIGALLLVAALRGCSADTSTNKYDSKNTKTITDGAIKLQKMADDKMEKISRDRAIEKNAEANAATKINESNNETTVELKKLDIDARQIVDVNAIEQKKTLDVNQQADREFELEKMRIQLLEAQKLKNETELKKLEIENNKSMREFELAEKEKADAIKAKAKADAERAKANAAAAKEKAKRQAEKDELELLKMLSQ